MARNFYIDGENTQDQWLMILPYLHPEDEVHMFYSDAVTRHAVYGCMVPCKYELHYCTAKHKNAMDFQVCAFASYMCGVRPERKHYIMSKDLGYDCAREVIPTQNLHRMSPYSYAIRERGELQEAALNTNPQSE